MNEYLKAEGHLAVMEKEARKGKIHLEGLRKSLRENLDPLEDIENLDADLIAQQAVEFAAQHTTYCEVLAKIKQAKKILGRA
jgi:hypothetical protein